MEILRGRFALEGPRRHRQPGEARRNGGCRTREHEGHQARFRIPLPDGPRRKLREEHRQGNRFGEYVPRFGFRNDAEHYGGEPRSRTGTRRGARPGGT